MINVKKALCGGLVASQLLGAGSFGSCEAIGGDGDYVYVGNSNNIINYDSGCNFVPGKSGNNCPQVIVVKEKRSKKRKKQSSGIGGKILAAGAVVAIGYWGFGYYKTLSDKDKVELLNKLEWLFGKVYNFAYIVNCFSRFGW